MYGDRYYRRKGMLNSMWQGFWSLVVKAIVLVLIILAIRWLIPWFKELGQTITPS